MSNLIIQVSRYLIIILMALYTFQCFSVLRQKDEEDRNFIFLRQNVLMFFLHFVCFTVLFLEIDDIRVLYFYGAQAAYLLITLVLFRLIYPLASRLLINNMCMLIAIGFVMITRISYDQSVRQFEIIAGSTVVALIVPVLIRKLRFLTKIYWFYAIAGLALLGMVAVISRSVYGAKITFTVAGITVQPSEFVKIIFVFAVAGLLANGVRQIRHVIITTILAAMYVLILVVSKDLGSALIFFVTYLVMLFVATRNPFLTLAGILAGCAAAVAAYFLFSHVRVRVLAWRDPFSDYYVGGYQICQSLFSIAAGNWFGTGLYQGSPTAITFVEQDFMFSAIAEELGSIFGICLILVCMSCFIMFVNISMQLKNRFYRLAAVGLGTEYATQVFLTVGGGIKLIPLTGVTLPLVSYGGSSALTTLIMFSIVQGMYMIHRDEERKKMEAQQLEEMQSGNAGTDMGQNDNTEPSERSGFSRVQKQTKRQKRKRRRFANDRMPQDGVVPESEGWYQDGFYDDGSIEAYGESVKQDDGLYGDDGYEDLYAGGPYADDYQNEYLPEEEYSPRDREPYDGRYHYDGRQDYGGRRKR